MIVVLAEVEAPACRWRQTSASAGTTRSLTLEIAEGEFFSLLGPRGCGKTTTLRMVAGFELPDCSQN